jgi:hypothetical protein
MKNYYLEIAEANEIVPGYYIWGEGEPQPNWSSYIGKLIENSEIAIDGKTKPCRVFQFADGLCSNCVLEKDFQRARPATRKEINAAIDREKKGFGLNPYFLDDNNEN